jgi:hypothetical protein
VIRWVVVLATACTSVSYTRPFVRSFTIDGRDVTVVKCPIAIDGDTLRAVEDRCFTEHLELPLPAIASEADRAPGAAP